MNDNIFIYDFKKLRNNQFKSEKELSEFISENIFEFTKYVLDDVLIDFEKERRISKRINGLLFGRKNKRIDIYIKGQKKNYILELKNPCYRNENLSAIGQILNYGLNYDNCDLIIFSTCFDYETAEVIKNYNLPIRYFYITKDYCMEYKGLINGE